MRLALVLLSMMLAAPTRAEWVEHGSGNIPLISSYYDPTTKKRGDVVSVWIFTDLKTPIDGQGRVVPLGSKLINAQYFQRLNRFFRTTRLLPPGARAVASRI
jgi:hypothetical protein